MSSILDVLAESEADKRLRQAQGDLYWLATNILKYDKLTQGFHLPMMREMDRRTRLRRAGKYAKDELELWARDHYKTTVRIAQMVQAILYDPDVAIAVAHAVDEKAQEIVREVGQHFLTNKELRRIRPEIMPPPRGKFLLADQFTIKRSRFSRHPTLQGKGAGSENTGGHCDIYVLDDIIGQSTIEDNAMPRIRNWYRNTVRNVLRTDGGWIWATGTRWDVDDIYQDWIDSSDWDVRVRACMETDGLLDYKGTSVLYSPKDIKKKQNELGPAFGPQMMNDPSPEGQKPWIASECEHYCKKDEVSESAFKVVLSDPAPAKIGSYIDDKKTPDGKNEWATVTVAFQTRGQRQEIILLDGSSSTEWGPKDGWLEICRQKRRWKTGNCAVEKTGQAVAFYMDELKRVSKDEGVKHREFDLSMTYKGKNVQFASLADRARSGEFLICETVPKGFVDRFLYQARNWRPLPSGRNTLKLDDCANAVSFATDPAFKPYIPSVSLGRPEWGQYFDEKPKEEYLHDTGHIAW